MKLHDTKHYDPLVRRLIFGSTRWRSSLYVTTLGNAAIGINFNLNDDCILDRVLETLGFDIDGKILGADALAAELNYIAQLRHAFNGDRKPEPAALKLTVHNILSARQADTRYRNHVQFRRAGKFILHHEHQVAAICNSAMKHYEGVVDNWLTGFGFDLLKSNARLLSRSTRERAVLVSLAAQQVVGNGADGRPLALPLAHALMDNDRPETWYQIRYALNNLTAPAAQVVKRRYLESELFGIYDQGITDATINRDYCKKMYAMYNAHKEAILSFERRFNGLIPEANAEFGLTGQHAIKTIEQSFDLAYNHVRSRPYTSKPVSNFVKAYTNYVEEGVEELVSFQEQQDDLDYEIAVAG